MNQPPLDHGAMMDFKRTVMDIPFDLRLWLKLQHIGHVERPRDLARNHQVRRVNFADDVTEFADDDHAAFAVDAADVALYCTVDAKSARIRQRAFNCRARSNQRPDRLRNVALCPAHGHSYIAKRCGARVSPPEVIVTGTERTVAPEGTTKIPSTRW